MKNIKSIGPKFCAYGKKHQWFNRKYWDIGDKREVASYRANAERKRRKLKRMSLNDQQ